MKNLVELATNKVLNEIIDTAVREALKLQHEADAERTKQKELEDAGEPYNYMKAHTIEEGVRGIRQVLWRMFGGMPIDSIDAIRKISKENNSAILGCDCQDYVEMFIETCQSE